MTIDLSSICSCGHKRQYHEFNFVVNTACILCNCRDFAISLTREICLHPSLKILIKEGGVSEVIYQCNHCGQTATFEWFTSKKESNMNLEALQNQVSYLEKELISVRNEIQKEKERQARKADFAVTSVPINMMDSEIRDESNVEHTRYTWVCGVQGNGRYRRRVPIRLMSDNHLKNVFGVFVKTPAHICYDEMKKEMIRRGLL